MPQHRSFTAGDACVPAQAAVSRVSRRRPTMTACGSASPAASHPLQTQKDAGGGLGLHPQCIGCAGHSGEGQGNLFRGTAWAEGLQLGFRVSGLAPRGGF